MFDPAVLLELQQLDTAIDQLAYRRSHGDPVTRVATIEASLAEHAKSEQVIKAERDELSARLDALEHEAVAAQTKAEKISAALYDGSVSAIKDLEALQHELEMLKQRQRGFEDEELELMEAAEPVDAQLADSAHLGAELSADLESARLALTVFEAEIDSETDKLSIQRDPLISRIPPEVIAEYEAIRARLGQGAARLAAGGKCEGCHLALPSAEYSEIKRQPGDAVIHCPECGRILVRP